MRFQDAFIVVIIVTIVLTGSFIFIGDLAEKHSATVDWDKAYKLNKTQTNIKELSEKMENTYTNLSGTNVDPAGSTDSYYKTFVAGLTTIKLVGDSWFFFGDLVSDLIGFFNLPEKIKDIVVVFVHGLIFVSVISMLIYAFWKWKVET